MNIIGICQEKLDWSVVTNSPQISMAKTKPSLHTHDESTDDLATPKASYHPCNISAIQGV